MCCSALWWSISHLGSLLSSSVFFHFAPLPKWFWKSYLWVHWSFLLPCQVWCWIVNFSVQLLLFSVGFRNFWISVGFFFIILLYHWYSQFVYALFSWFYLVVCAPFEFIEHLWWLFQILWQLISLHLFRVSFRKFNFSFKWATFPCFFVCFVIYCWDFGIWKISHSSPQHHSLVLYSSDSLSSALLEILEIPQAFSGGVSFLG